MTGGTYTLLIELPVAATVDVGALGAQRLRAGWYAYTGSALGSGGFSRIDRHYALAVGDREVRHWHIDYLLCHPATAVRGDVRTPEFDIECAVAESLSSAGIDGFGSSDCDCNAHLAYDSHGARLQAAVERAHRHARADAVT